MSKTKKPQEINITYEKDYGFQDIPNDTKAATHVGLFLQQWAVVEAQLNKIVGRLLGLTSLQTFIVTSNMTFREKINIIRTSIRTLPNLDEEDQEKFDKIILKIGNTYYDRNTAAHELFWWDEKTNSVEFNSIKAKGGKKPIFPSVKWSEKDFAEKSVNLHSLSSSLDILLKLFPKKQTEENLLLMRDQISSTNLLSSS